MLLNKKTKDKLSLHFQHFAPKSLFFFCMFQFFYFIWTTIAGGQGSIPFGNNKQQNLSVMVQQQINESSASYSKWDGPYFRGTEEEAVAWSRELSIMAKVETSLFMTDRGVLF